MPIDPQTGQEVDAWGRPVINRNRRRAQFGWPGSIDGDGFGFGSGGPGSTTTTTGGGASPFGVAQQALGYAGMAKDAYNLANGKMPWDGLFGGGSSAATAPAPEFGNLVFTDPGSLTGFEAGFGVGTDAGGSLAGFEGGFGMGVDPMAGFEAGFGVGGWGGAAPATGPGGLLPGGGVTSVGGEGAAGAAGGMGPLGYGAAGMAAMMALIALGGGFEGETPTLSLESTLPIGPNGLGAPNWQDTSLMGMEAPDSFYAAGDQLYGGLLNAAPAGDIDQSWMRPEAGVRLQYRSDADIGLDNPRPRIEYGSGNFAPTREAGTGTTTGGWELRPTWQEDDLGSMLDRLGTQRNPLLDAAPTWQTLGLDPQSVAELSAGRLFGGFDNTDIVSQYANLMKKVNPADTAHGDLLQMALQAWEAQNRS